MDIQAACIDPVHYQVIASFNQPSLTIKQFEFSPETNNSRTIQQSFAKNISGIKILGHVFEKKGLILVIGTIGGTIHLWDLNA